MRSVPCVPSRSGRVRRAERRGQPAGHRYVVDHEGAGVVTAVGQHRVAGRIGEPRQPQAGTVGVVEERRRLVGIDDLDLGRCPDVKGVGMSCYGMYLCG